MGIAILALLARRIAAWCKVERKTGARTPQKEAAVHCVHGYRALVLDLAALCVPEGDTAERAIELAARESGFVREVMERAFVRVQAKPFSEQTQYMYTVHRFADGYRMIMKGAPDAVLRHCLLRTREREEISEECAKMSGQALHVLGVAYKDVQTPDATPADDLIFAGFLVVTEAAQEA